VLYLATSTRPTSNDKRCHGGPEIQSLRLHHNLDPVVIYRSKESPFTIAKNKRDSNRTLDVYEGQKYDDTRVAMMYLPSTVASLLRSCLLPRSWQHDIPGMSCFLWPHADSFRHHRRRALDKCKTIRLRLNKNRQDSQEATEIMRIHVSLNSNQASYCC
jgi:hypothetical protein